MSLMEGEQKLRRKPYFFMALFFTERQKSLVILAEELLKSIVKKSLYSLVCKANILRTQ